MFNESNRPGVYFRVLQEGVIEVGQEFKLAERERVKLSITELFQLSQGRVVEPEKVREYLDIKALGSYWREKFQRMLEAT